MSRWDGRLVSAEGPLCEWLPRFVEWQAARWPRLAEARRQRTRTRSLRLGSREVVLQWNPGRTASTTAKVDAASVRARPCFLCRLPPEEHGVAFEGGWVILCNPAPILPDHLVLAHRDHRPQRVRDALSGLLDLPLATEGAFTTIYNGPRSGASAPDHLHVQAFQAGHMPEERVLIDVIGGAPPPGTALPAAASVRAWVDDSARRTTLGLAGPPAAVRAALGDLLDTLDTEDLNLVAAARDDTLGVLLFPRRAHRPACYSAPEPERFVLSPGAIDMAGVVITVRERDFARIDAAVLTRIFAEVSLPHVH